LQGEVELGSGELNIKRSLIWIKAVDIEDGNYETVTTRMQPSVIVWDLETVPDLAGFAAANDLPKAWLSFSEMLVSHALHCSDL
jgi:hypothetical protein